MHPALLVLIIALSSLTGLALILSLLFLFLIKPRRRRESLDFYKGFKYAHRGLHGGGRVENSMSAFKAAVDAGFGIELDVRLSSDGTIVVFHDDTLLRVCGIDERVRDKSCEELSKIKLGESEDTVPTFSEVLSLVSGKVPLLVEIKADASDSETAYAVCEALSEYTGPYIIESFNPLALKTVRDMMPDIHRGQLSMDYRKDPKFRTLTHTLLNLFVLNFLAKPDFIAFSHTDCDHFVFRLINKLYRPAMFAWTVKSPEDEKKCLDGIFDTVIFEDYVPAEKGSRGTV